MNTDGVLENRHRIRVVHDFHTTHGFLHYIFLPTNCVLNSDVCTSVDEHACQQTVQFWQHQSGAHTEFFTRGRGADPEAIYNLCSILKTML
jgi:hypothetical protein